MPVVTGLKLDRNKKKVRLYLDGKYTCTLLTEITTEHGIRSGSFIDDGNLKSLLLADTQRRCFNSACHLLDYRPRSEHEIRHRLTAKGFDSETTEAVCRQLKAGGLLDDGAFARFWTDNRLSFKPQSANLTRRELRQKGLAEKIVLEATGEYDDFDNACRAAAGRLSRLAGLDYSTFRRRLGTFLQRRGFGYGVIKPVLEKMWRQLRTVDSTTEK